MTVEQSCALPYGPVCRKSDNDLILISEVTGISDRKVIEHAITRCCDQKGLYRVNDVINHLLGDDVEIGSSPSSTVTVSSTNKAVATVDLTEPLVSSQKATKEDTIDLTAVDSDIERAVAESLKESQGILGGQVTREDEEISKVLERSLAEDTKLGTKRKRSDLWFVDPLNPHERKRLEGWPVGLKNVGNTCWFSAVIQSLFHLPVFRKLVLRFVPPAAAEEEDQTSSCSRNLQFMKELRRLFALMVASKRKYVDPSKAIDILKEAFSSHNGIIGSNSSDSQQDVSEFQHKLLEWLEDAFRLVECPSSASPVSTSETADSYSRASNPMVKLFYGQYLSAGFNEGTRFEKKDMFGQLPLQVDGFKDIHESLEAATAQGEIETLNEGLMSKSCQEQWFVHLPPVLTFELSRFQFNKNLARPEKIHNRLEFPPQIYVDRYLECNRALTRQKRDEARKLREALRNLQSRLDRFVNYGSGPKRFPIHDVLQYALEFAQTHTAGEQTMLSPAATAVCHMLQPPMLADVEMESPLSQNGMVVESPLSSPIKYEATATICNDDDDGADGVPLLPCLVEPVILRPPQHVDKAPDVMPESPLLVREPSPRNVSNEELRVLQTCLTRWRKEVEQDVKDLQKEIEQREEQLEAMYCDPELTKCGYRLHAVLVHEGQAASGHYWAYVYSPAYGSWLKFNDVSVDTASWDDVLKDGVGGYHNTSAYCIMYVNWDHADLQQISACGNEIENTVSCSAESDAIVLPADLQKYVDEDNEKFVAELIAWDSEQRKKQSRSAGTDAGVATQSGSSVTTQSTRQSTISQHLDLFSIETKDKARMMLDRIKDQNVDNVIEESFKEACQEADRSIRMQQSLTMKDDVRLRDVFTYFLANGADTAILQRTFYEKLAIGLDGESSEGAKLLKKSIGCKLGELMKNPNSDKCYTTWHQTYRRFREVVFAFVHGMRAFINKSYSEALAWFVEALQLNDSLVTLESPQASKALDGLILSHFHRQCVVHVNGCAVDTFKTEDSVADLFGELQKYFLPSFYILVCSQAKLDQDVVDTVRNSWCEVLSTDYPEAKRERLQDFLTAVLDASADVVRQLTIRTAGELRQYRELGDRLALEYSIAVSEAEAQIHLDSVEYWS